MEAGIARTKVLSSRKRTLVVSDGLKPLKKEISKVLITPLQQKCFVSLIRRGWVA